MHVDYSKPASDLACENRSRLANETELFQRQTRAARVLLDCSGRTHCVLCESNLQGEEFSHRSIPMMVCSVCGHIQTKAVPPSQPGGFGFEAVYPRLDFQEYHDRKQRIYRPKLDWIVSRLRDNGYGEDNLKTLHWREIGCGAGYFLASLQDFGAEHFDGFDANAQLVQLANEFVPGLHAHCFEGSVTDLFGEADVDVYVAFFVLEHLNSISALTRKLKELSRGTLLAFSVPVFGFSCLVEAAFSERYARCLDCVVHTQIYTEQSISYLLDKAQFQILGQWIFGQDASDLLRCLQLQAEPHLPQAFRQQLAACLPILEDQLQQPLDRMLLSDQRHILALKA